MDLEKLEDTKWIIRSHKSNRDRKWPQKIKRKNKQ